MMKNEFKKMSLYNVFHLKSTVYSVHFSAGYV